MSSPSVVDQDWFQQKAIQTLFQCYPNDKIRIVGGAVRDAIIGKPVHDVDFATTLSPEEGMNILGDANIDVRPTGLKHGTIMAILYGQGYEITTLREDVETDGRHAKVAFTSDWKIDASRRDFTMNALYADRAGEIYDFFSGIADAKAGRVRFVGDAEERIKEDYLRILRFFRFHAHYGKGVPPEKVLKALAKHGNGLGKLSGERIRQEMLRLCEAKKAFDVVELMQRNGVLKQIGIPSLDLNKLEKKAEMIAKLADPKLRSALWLTALIMCSDTTVDAIAESWKLSNAQADAAANALEMPMLDWKEACYRYGRTVALIQALKREERVMEEILHYTIPVFPLAGQDLLDQGMEPGPAMGEALKKAEVDWIKSGYLLSREELLPG